MSRDSRYDCRELTVGRQLPQKATKERSLRSAQAWRRLALLQRNEELTREKYVSCVQEAAQLLAKDGFLSAEAVASYIERAKTADLMPKEESAPP